MTLLEDKWMCSVSLGALTQQFLSRDRPADCDHLSNMSFNKIVHIVTIANLTMILQDPYNKRLMDYSTDKEVSGFN